MDALSVLILVLMDYKWNEREELVLPNLGRVLILVLMDYKWNALFYSELYFRSLS